MSDTSHSLLKHLRNRSDPEAWQRLVDLYTPLFHSWLRRYDVLSAADVDDLVQEVLLAVSQDLPKFDHNERPGAFRCWLKTILVHRLRKFWDANHKNPMPIGGSDFLKQLDDLEDGSSRVSAIFDREHDQHVMSRLLAMIKPQFADQTWTMFHRVAVEGASPEDVAREAGLSINSVYTAKSRVLKALREAADGLLS